jgi:hypothetical protein
MSVIIERNDYKLIMEKNKLDSMPDTYELVFRREVKKDDKVQTYTNKIYMSSSEIEKLKAAL